MKKVLALVDFSKGSINALKYAVSIFERENVEFVILHTQALNVSSYNSVADLSIERLTKKNNKKLDDLAYELESSYNSKFSAINLQENLINAINIVLKKDNYECVIMGVSTKRAIDLNDFTWSYKTAKIIKQFRKQTFLIVPETYQFKNLKKVLFSANYKKVYSKKEFQLLFKLINNYGSSFIISQFMQDDFMTESQDVSKKSLKSIIEKIPHSFVKIDLELSEFVSIRAFAYANSINMIALMNHKLSFFNSLLEEHVAEKASIYSKIPVLILPEFE